MDNLHELRQDIRLRLAFEDKIKSHYNIVQFFLTLERFNKIYTDYSCPKLYGGIFSGLNKNIDPREKYASFDEYLNMRVFHSCTPSTYALIAQPSTDISTSSMEKCLSHWSKIIPLYYKVKEAIPSFDLNSLHLVKGEPSMVTISKILNPADFHFMAKVGTEKIEKPNISLLPISYMWKFHNHTFKTSLQLLCILVVLLILGIIGISCNKQPYTCLGALAVGAIIAFFLGFILHNIHSLIRKENHEKTAWAPAVTGLATGVIFFFSSFSVQNYIPHRPTAQPTSFYESVREGSETLTVYTTEYGECYHIDPNCPTLSRSSHLYETTEKKAAKHYRPCQRCTGY